MFENGGDGNLLGAVFDNRDVANRNAAAARRAQEVGRQWQARAEELQARVAELELLLAQENAHTAGLLAQLNAHKADAPESRLLKPSGQKYQDGTAKTVGRLIYEEAVDRVARERFGVADPRELRAD